MSFGSRNQPDLLWLHSPSVGGGTGYPLESLAPQAACQIVVSYELSCPQDPPDTEAHAKHVGI